MKKVFSIGIVILFLGCSHKQVIEDLDYPLMDIQKGVGESLPGGVSRVSSNQREYTSGFFRTNVYDKQQSEKKSKGHVPMERAYAKALILGDRRPYSLEVSVTIQNRLDDSGFNPKNPLDIQGGNFEDDRQDDRLAERIVINIREYLVKRSRTKNLIEDFRPF